MTGGLGLRYLKIWMQILSNKSRQLGNSMSVHNIQLQFYWVFPDLKITFTRNIVTYVERRFIVDFLKIFNYNQ